MTKKTQYAGTVLNTIALGIMILAMQSCGRIDTASSGSSFVNDPDNDGVQSIYDNCPNVANGAQADINNNGIGDACDQTDQNNPPASSATAFANAVIVSADQEVDGCDRIIVWEDKSNNETKFTIRINYHEFDYDEFDEPTDEEYEYNVRTILISDPATAQTRTYTDNEPNNSSLGIRYKIITEYQDGSEQETDWFSSGSGC